jgi:hypothetical protein
MAKQSTSGEQQSQRPISAWGCGATRKKVEGPERKDGAQQLRYGRRGHDSFRMDWQDREKQSSDQRRGFLRHQQQYGPVNQPDHQQVQSNHRRMPSCGMETKELIVEA